MSEQEAYDAYLAAIAAERSAIQVFLAADNAEPFNRETFDEAEEGWKGARYIVVDAKHAWYKAIGDQYNPEKIRL